MSTSDDTESVNSSIEYHSLKDDTEAEMKNNENIFEDSDDDLELVNERVENSEKIEIDGEPAWAKLPPGTKEFCSKANGIMYIERYESFINNNWPFDLKKGNLCHPRALALAGLVFYSLQPNPSAQCTVCLTILSNLQQNSNPWILHLEANPECYFIKLGQRDKVDDYSLDEVVEMCFKRIYKEAQVNLMEKEKNLKKQLFALKKHEIALENTE